MTLVVMRVSLSFKTIPDVFFILNNIISYILDVYNGCPEWMMRRYTGGKELIAIVSHSYCIVYHTTRKRGVYMVRLAG